MDSPSCHTWVTVTALLSRVARSFLMPLEYTTGPDFIAVDFQNSNPEELKAHMLSKWEADGFAPL